MTPEQWQRVGHLVVELGVAQDTFVRISSR